MATQNASKGARRRRRERLAGVGLDALGPAAGPSDLKLTPRDFAARADRPAFAYLSDAKIEALQDRAFKILEEHGIAINHEEAVELLAKFGAKVDVDGKTVRFSRGLVEEAIDATPKSVTLYGKTPEYTIELPREDGTFHTRTGTGAHAYIDHETGEYRKLVLDDVRTIAAVGDGLDQVGFIAHPFVNDVPERTADIHALSVLLGESVKHSWIQPYDVENVEYLMKLAVVAAGGEDELRAKPLVNFIHCSFSPLEYKRMDIEVILQTARHGVPIHAASLPTGGGTAPVTPIATTLMAVTENLGSIVLAYALSEGNPTPVIAIPLIFALEMRTGRSLHSSIEAIQGATMAAQVMKRGFGIMTQTYGLGSDTPEVDAQSQVERALLAFAVALSGADILGGVGQLETATVFSPVQAVIDNDLAAMLRRYLATPQVDDGSLNWDEMLNVPMGGHFLASEHTLENCRTQLPSYSFVSQARDTYEESGGREALGNARDICRALVNRDRPQGLPDDDQLREMAQIVAAADRHLAD